MGELIGNQNIEMEPNPVGQLGIGNNPDDNNSNESNATTSSGTGAGALYSADQASQTEIRVENLVHNWTVKNFSHCYQEYLENFVHLNKGDEQLTWSVKIYPKGNGDNNKEFVFLCLNRVLSTTAQQQPMPPSLPHPNVSARNMGTGGGKIGFRSRFTLRNGDGKEIDMRVHPNPSHSDYVSYIKRDVLFPLIMPQDLIVVTVAIDVAVETVTVCQADQMHVPNTNDQLILDYGRLLTEEGLRALADFNVRVGDRCFPVHRAVLASRSEVFRAMVSHKSTHESEHNEMNITDLDADVVGEMIAYIYTGIGGCERGLHEFPSELLVAADKYSLHDLKAHCEKALVNSLTVDEVCSMLVLSDLHQAPRLRAKAIEFILQHSREVTATHGWQQMLQAHAGLVTEVVQNFTRAPHAAHASAPGVPSMMSSSTPLPDPLASSATTSSSTTNAQRPASSAAVGAPRRQL